MVLEPELGPSLVVGLNHPRVFVLGLPRNLELSFEKYAVDPVEEDEEELVGIDRKKVSWRVLEIVAIFQFQTRSIQGAALSLA